MKISFRSNEDTKAIYSINSFGNKMKNIRLLIFFVWMLPACGDGSTSHSLANPPHKPVATKHIEPGENFIFTCTDSFHRTTVTIVAAWDATTSSWITSAEEFDGSGNTVSKQDKLVGKPDSIQSWQMNIMDSSGLFAIISQNGSDQAICRARGRNLDCRFN